MCFTGSLSGIVKKKRDCAYMHNCSDSPFRKLVSGHLNWVTLEPLNADIFRTNISLPIKGPGCPDCGNSETK